MPVTIHARGEYELFESEEDNRVLVLDHRDQFAWVESHEGEILIRSDTPLTTDQLRSHGAYYLVEFKGRPEFPPVPHLLLQEAERFWIYQLPQGMASPQDAEKPIVRSDQVLSVEEFERWAQPAAR